MLETKVEYPLASFLLKKFYAHNQHHSPSMTILRYAHQLSCITTDPCVPHPKFSRSSFVGQGLRHGAYHNDLPT